MSAALRPEPDSDAGNRQSPAPSESQDETPVVPVDVSIRSVALTVLATVAGVYLLHWAQQVFVPVVLAILISYALEPLVRSLVKVRVPRPVASAGIVGLLVVSLVSGIYAFTDDAQAIVAKLPDAAQTLRRVMNQDRGERALDHVQRAAEELQATADEAAVRNPAPNDVLRVQVEQPAIDLRQYFTWGSAGLAFFVAQSVLVVFFVFFLLASGDLFRRKLVKIAGPSLAKKKITVHILEDINTQIGRFLLIRVLTSVIVGIASWIAFHFVGLEQAGLWAIAAGVLNSIPYFGPMIVAAGTALVAFLQFETIAMAGYVSGLSLVITSAEGWLLTPWLTSHASRTNEVAIFLALIFWTFVWGIWGTLLAVPMLVVVKAFCDRVEDLQPLGELLGK